MKPAVADAEGVKALPLRAAPAHIAVCLDAAGEIVQN
jgi:hypothetical protein